MDQNAGAAIFGSLSQMLAPHNMIRTLEGANRLNEQKRRQAAMDEGIKDLNFRATKDPALKKRINSAKAMFPNALASPEEFARFSSHIQEGQMAEEMVDELEQNGLLGSSGLADFYRKQATLNPSNAIRDMHSFVQGQEAFALRNAKEQEAKALADKTKLELEAASMEMGRRVFEQFPDDVAKQYEAIGMLPVQNQMMALKQLNQIRTASRTEGIDEQAEEDKRLKAEADKAKATKERADELAKRRGDNQVMASALRTLDLPVDVALDHDSTLDAIMDDEGILEKLDKIGLKDRGDISNFITSRNEELGSLMLERQAAKAASDAVFNEFDQVGNTMEKRGQVVDSAEGIANALVVRGTGLQGTLPDLGGEKAGEDTIFGSPAGTPSVTERYIVKQDDGFYNVVKDASGRYIGFGFTEDLGTPKIVEMELDDETKQLVPARERDEQGNIVVDEAGAPVLRPPVNMNQYRDTVRTIVMSGVQERDPDVSMTKAIRKLDNYMKRVKGNKSIETPAGQIARDVRNLKNAAEAFSIKETKEGFKSVREGFTTADQDIKAKGLTRTAKRDQATKLATQYMILLQKLHALERGAYIQGE